VGTPFSELNALMSVARPHRPRREMAANKIAAKCVRKVPPYCNHGRLPQRRSQHSASARRDTISRIEPLALITAHIGTRQGCPKKGSSPDPSAILPSAHLLRYPPSGKMPSGFRSRKFHAPLSAPSAPPIPDPSWSEAQRDRKLRSKAVNHVRPNRRGMCNRDCSTAMCWKMFTARAVVMLNSAPTSPFRIIPHNPCARYQDLSAVQRSIGLTAPLFPRASFSKKRFHFFLGSCVG